MFYIPLSHSFDPPKEDGGPPMTGWQDLANKLFQDILKEAPSKEHQDRKSNESNQDPQFAPSMRHGPSLPPRPQQMRKPSPAEKPNDMNKRQEEWNYIVNWFPGKKEYQVVIEVPGVSNEDISLKLQTPTYSAGRITTEDNPCIIKNLESETHCTNSVIHVSIVRQPWSSKLGPVQVGGNPSFWNGKRTFGVKLPSNVDTESITATEQNGLLILTFTVLNQTTERTIPVSRA